MFAAVALFTLRLGGHNTSWSASPWPALCRFVDTLLTSSGSLPGTITLVCLRLTTHAVPLLSTPYLHLLVRPRRPISHPAAGHVSYAGHASATPSVCFSLPCLHLPRSFSRAYVIVLMVVTLMHPQNLAYVRASTLTPCLCMRFSLSC